MQNLHKMCLMATTSAVGTVSSGSQSDAKLTQDVESSTNVRSIFQKFN
jgi:hypothetical protein